MDKTGFVSQGGYQEVPLAGQFNCGSALSTEKRGEDQQPAFCQSFLPFGRQPHLFYTAGRADDGRLPPPQKDAQTLFFNRGMKAADHGFWAVTQATGKVKGFKYIFAGVNSIGTKPRLTPKRNANMLWRLYTSGFQPVLHIGDENISSYVIIFETMRA